MPYGSTLENTNKQLLLMKYNELQPVILLQDILKAIQKDDIDKLAILLEELRVELPTWINEIKIEK
jgi:hypothetical protein